MEQNHRYSAEAEINGTDVAITVTCETEGVTSPAKRIPLAEVGSFLDIGFTGVLIGELPENLFSAVVDALKEAGVNVPAGYDLN